MVAFFCPPPFMKSGGGASPPGQREWTSAGTYDFEVPAGVTSISAVCVGRGGPSGGSAQGGRGGDLRWVSSLAVTPLETLTISIVNNQPTQILRSGTPLLVAASGGLGTSTYGTSTAIGGIVGGGNGGNGTAHHLFATGGGAGGYSGNGGAGVINSVGFNAGSGGAGAGGNGSSGGGGVGIKGAGASGAAAGQGGSGGGNASGLAGGVFGGGCTFNDTARGEGAVRVIWGTGRAYPSTNTADV